jgi:enoyl-[acyl-carrier-protein] reductase (NADH)
VKDKLGRVDMVMSLFLPSPTMEPEALLCYPHVLLERGLAAGKFFSASGEGGAILHHCFLPSLYAGTKFDDYLPLLRGSITGVTRTLCRAFGKDGVRVNVVQSGLIDLPELKGFISSQVMDVLPPVGRWGTASEVAKLMVFLALRATYISGQTIVIDGGVTSGITGT